MSKKGICQKCGKIRKKFRSNDSMRVGKNIIICRSCAKKIMNNFLEVKKKEAAIVMPIPFNQGIK